MPWFRRHKKQEPGKPIEARTLRMMAETCDWASQLQANPPFGIMSTGNGPLLRYAGQVLNIQIGVVATAIGARSSSTPGSGTVNVYTWDGSTLNELGGPGNPSTFTVYSMYSDRTFLAGDYVLFIEVAGSYWVLAGAGAVHGYTQFTGSVSPVSGTYPSLTPTIVSNQTIYRWQGGSFRALAGTHDVYNWRNVTWSANKTTVVVANTDGSWDIVDQDC